MPCLEPVITIEEPEALDEVVTVERKVEMPLITPKRLVSKIYAKRTRQNAKSETKGAYCPSKP